MVNQWWGTGLKARVSGHPALSFLKKVIGREVGRGERRCVSLPRLSQMWSTCAWPSRCAWATPDVIQGFRERGYESTWEPVNGYPVSQINLRLVPVLICLWCVTTGKSLATSKSSAWCLSQGSLNPSWHSTLPGKTMQKRISTMSVVPRGSGFAAPLGWKMQVSWCNLLRGANGIRTIHGQPWFQTLKAVPRPSPSHCLLSCLRPCSLTFPSPAGTFSLSCLSKPPPLTIGYQGFVTVRLLQCRICPTVPQLNLPSHARSGSNHPFCSDAGQANCGPALSS